MFFFIWQLKMIADVKDSLKGISLNITRKLLLKWLHYNGWHFRFYGIATASLWLRVAVARQDNICRLSIHRNGLCVQLTAPMAKFRERRALDAWRTAYNLLCNNVAAQVYSFTLYCKLVSWGKHENLIVIYFVRKVTLCKQLHSRHIPTSTVLQQGMCNF